jgi:hypothetical protein
VGEKNFKGLYKILKKIISFDMKKRVKWKISHEKSEEKNEFKNPWSESLRFKCDTPIMLGPKSSSSIQASSLDSINAHNTCPFRCLSHSQ